MKKDEPNQPDQPPAPSRAAWNAWIGARMLDRAWLGQRFVWEWERKTDRKLTSATAPLFLNYALWSRKADEAPDVFVSLASPLREACLRARHGDDTHLHAIAEALLNRPIAHGRRGQPPAAPWRAERDEELVQTFERVKDEVVDLDALLPKRVKSAAGLFEALPSESEMKQLVPTLEEDGRRRLVVRNGWLERVVLGGREALRPLLGAVSQSRRPRGPSRYEAALSVWARERGLPLSSARAELAGARDRVKKRKMSRQRGKKKR